MNHQNLPTEFEQYDINEDMSVTTTGEAYTNDLNQTSCELDHDLTSNVLPINTSSNFSPFPHESTENDWYGFKLVGDNLDKSVTPRQGYQCIFSIPLLSEIV